MYQTYVDEYIESDEYLKDILPKFKKVYHISKILVKSPDHLKSDKTKADSLLTLVKEIGDFYAIANIHSDDQKDGIVRITHSLRWDNTNYALKHSVFGSQVGLIDRVIPTAKGFFIVKVDSVSEREDMNDIKTLDQFKNFLKLKKLVIPREKGQYSNFLQLKIKTQYPLVYNHENIDIFLKEFKQISERTINEIKFTNLVLAESELGRISSTDIPNKMFIDRGFFSQKLIVMSPYDIKKNFIDKIYKHMILNFIASNYGIKLTKAVEQSIQDDLRVFCVEEYKKHLGKQTLINESDIKEEYERRQKKENLSSYSIMRITLLETIKYRNGKSLLDKTVNEVLEKDKHKIQINL